MISFIIIGKNEGWKLTQCLRSVFNSIEYCNLKNYEVVYVDSNSSDDSIDRARKFKQVKIFQITGVCNAAIARNIGAKEALGAILFFIDGDMEIMKDFLSHILNINKQLTYGFIGGWYENYNYNDAGDLIGITRYPSAKKLVYEYFEPETGGLFIIRKDLWNLGNGMKNYLYSGEDPDFALRMAKKGVYKLRVNKKMAIHHTVKFTQSHSIKSIFTKRFLSGQIILFRENILSLKGLCYFFKKQPSLTILILVIFLSLLINSGYPLIVYLSIQLLRAAKKKSLKRYIYLLVKDFVLLSGFFVYFPSRRPKVQYMVPK
jgi:glycosyltransferase involved in cell wall biosynthesis